MANTVTSPKSTALYKTYEKAGQSELMGNKNYLISDIVADLQNGIGNPVEVIDTTGAISSTHGLVLLTKAGVAVMTLAAPVAADNGKILRIISTTANAHTVTTPSAKLNETSAIGTFGGAKGDNIVLVAYNTSWWVLSKVNVTLS